MLTIKDNIVKVQLYSKTTKFYCTLSMKILHIKLPISPINNEVKYNAVPFHALLLYLKIGSH